MTDKVCQLPGGADQVRVPSSRSRVGQTQFRTANSVAQSSESRVSNKAETRSIVDASQADPSPVQLTQTQSSLVNANQAQSSL